MTEYIIGFVLLAVAIIGGTCCFFTEKKLWNGGVCSVNGLPWISFDMDSQGGRGYKAGNEYLWVSWPTIDKNYLVKQELT